MANPLVTEVSFLSPAHRKTFSPLFPHPLNAEIVAVRARFRSDTVACGCHHRYRIFAEIGRMLLLTGPALDSQVPASVRFLSHICSQC